jgi:TRAP-type C4-dicarboxylate transport system permease small subunit
VSDSADGDGSAPDPSDDPAAPPGASDVPSGGGVPVEASVPPTRRQPSVQPPDALSALGGDLHFPDDSPGARGLRVVDRALGVAEQVVLFVLLAAVVVTAAAAALSDRLLHIPLGRWWFDIVRSGTFSIAMIGAVFATHQRRHLAMDLVSRRLPPRGRLILRIALAVFTMFIAGVLARSGLHQLDKMGEESGDHLISTHTIVTLLPAGAALIILHTLLHMVIDIDYLVRGKLPPERMRSGH